MKYLKQFKQASEYEAFKAGDEYITPNVSYVEDGNLYYNPAKSVKTMFNVSLYEDRKEMYDLMFDAELSTPFYFY